MKNYTILFLSLIIFSSCLSENETSFTPQTEADIIKYIETNRLDAKKTDSGLYYVITKEGTGNKPANSSANVTVAYKGYFLNGDVFDANSNGYTTDLNRVIKGWTEGIQLFKEGGEGVLIIPSNLGYGAAGNSAIPGGAVLVFDIKLISVN